jgi:hypothetical protein
MKVEQRSRQVEGGLPGEKIFATINAEDMPFVISTLTDLYEDSEMAVIREYSTNARDAMIEAGKAGEPIQVQLPTPLSPYLRIKDFGIGLDTEDIREIYSRYGASTKRNSNEVVGMLGLGCKSALTYGDSFTLSSVKDGNKIEVAISRDEESGIVMKVVDEYVTDDPNGVEVIIPVTGYHNFETKAAEFYSYWEEGTVLVNGEAPKRINGFWVADDLLVTEGRGEDTIVMGNVPYPFPNDYSDWQRNYSITAFVPIGEVNFTPSRESLKTNALTKATIERVLKRVEEEAGTAVTKLIEDSGSKPEALALYNQFTGIFKSKFKVEATYKGKEIPNLMDAPKVGTRSQEFIVVEATKTKSYRSKGWSRMNAYPSTIWNKTIFIRGYDGADFSPYKRKKMDQWMAEQGDMPEYQNVVFTSSVPNHHWIEKGRIFPWQEIKDQKIVREDVKLPSGRVSGSYEGYVNGTYQLEILAEDIDTTKPILYAEKSYGYSHDAFSLANQANPNGWTFLQIGSNRVNKLVRDFPNAKPLNEYIKEMAQEWADELTDDDKLHLVIQEKTDSYEYNFLNGVTVEDPNLQAAIDQVFNKDTTLVKKHQTFKGYVNVSEDIEWSDPLDNYPLLTEMRFYGTMNATMRNHVALYVNAAYAAGQEEA